MTSSRMSLTPFRRLQWRLTFSYTLVTVGALLVVELLIVGLLLLFLNSSVVAREIAGTLKDDLTHQASFYLEESPQDIDDLNEWLRLVVDDSVAVSREGRRLTRGLSIEFDQNYQIYVIDNEGLLLAQVSDQNLSAPLKAPFNVASVPGLSHIFDAANRSNSSIDQLYVTNPDGTLVVALPIENLRGEIQGMMVVTMQMPAFNIQTLKSIAILILLSAIPITLAAGIIGSIFGFLTARGLTRRIESLEATSEAWSRGDFSTMTADNSVDELGQLSRRLNVMAERLQNLMESHQELAAIEERNRLARELHDSVKQQVFAMTMQLAAAKALLPDDPTEARKYMDAAEKLSRESQEELALLIHELRPTPVQGEGLEKVLERYVSDWSQQSGISASLDSRYKVALSLPIEQTLFRVSQEALSNCVRHSGARSVTVSLSSDQMGAVLSIRDDGHGFDPATAGKRGFGLQSMRERIEDVSGSLVIKTAPGSGTEVLVQIPAERPDD